MHTPWLDRILDHVNKPGYKAQTIKALSKRLQVPPSQKNPFRDAVKQLVREGAVSFGKNHEVRSSQKPNLIRGTIRVTASGVGFVRPEGQAGADDIFIPGFAIGDAMSGDSVMVELAKGRSSMGPRGIIADVVERATKQFVGTYTEKGGQGYVIVDAGVINEPVHVGDPGAKGAKPGDKVVLELIRYPTPERGGQGVITEVLGPANSATVETLSVIRAFNIPEHFGPEALEEARVQASRFNENNLDGRRDFTKDRIITIDPADAKDFDDAVRVRFDPVKKHWFVDVHIADVAHFVPQGTQLDREAKDRATSVYLPQKVIPMLPEIISNHLASLQEGQLRYVQSVLMEFDATGEPMHTEYVRGAIRVCKRFAYEQVSAFYKEFDTAALRAGGVSPLSESGIAPDIEEMLLLLRKFTLMRRKRRYKQGSLELSMPEVELDYDDKGKVEGAHLASHDIAHQVIEECMLSANEAVATKLNDLKALFLRRIHPAPEPVKLEDFLTFVKSLGYEVNRQTPTDRFQLQRVIKQSNQRPDQYAVHYAMLRSMKQAVYSPKEEGHYALASKQYCHFTSPIRRYPDLTVHRLLTRWQLTGKVGNDQRELELLGEHCSNMERRADKAEQELIKIRLLDYLSDKIGSVWKAIITGVENFGFFCTPTQIPVDGLVRIAALADDYYHYDETTHTLIGTRKKKRFRLGDTVWVEVARVDVFRRRLDFRVVEDPTPPQVPAGATPTISEDEEFIAALRRPPRTKERRSTAKKKTFRPATKPKKKSGKRGKK
ncbi:MAG TPA: ribonuclease R [Gemmatales bacterium]|nr:ribonuclease R [Gemmatales bacterium]